MKDMKPQIALAIQLMRAEIRWKPNSAERHLRKRQHRRHLPEEATLDDYETVIRQVLYDESAQAYLFWYDDVPYVTIVTIVENNTWLVMFNLRGLMETAFLVKRPDRYLSTPDYEYIGRLSEVLHNEL